MTSAIEISPFVLPSSIVTRSDLMQLLHEIERIDGELTAAAARAKVGVSTDSQIVGSAQVSDFLNANQLQLGDGNSRNQLVHQLRQLKDKAPTIHVTFASAADRKSLATIVSWLRQSVHPQSVLSVGLQPDLIGGVYIRTPNHVYDLSVRARLAGHRQVLIDDLAVLSGGQHV